MAALPAYAYASLPLVLIGLWHAICSCRSYARSPSLFYARTWHPLSRFRYGELIAELVAIIGATVFHSITVSAMQQGSTPQILALQQLLMLLFFACALLFTLISETTPALPLPHDANFLLLGIGFCVESFVVFCSVSDPQLALESESFHIQAGLSTLTALTCFLLAWRPASILVSIMFSSSLTLQGSWLLQLGLSLYVDRFLPEGCHRLSTGYTQCDVDAAKQRAMALIDMAFIMHVLVVVFVYGLIYALSARGNGHSHSHSHRRTSSGYEAMDINGESDHLQMKPMSMSTKVVID